MILTLLQRAALTQRLRAALRSWPVVLLVGPRQCGKTTLARRFAADRRAAYFDLEDPEAELRPETAARVLRPLRGLVVIDECQRQPGLFPLLRVLAHRHPSPARFLLISSAAPGLARGLSDASAGRARLLEMGGLRLEEAGPGLLGALWARGGLPPSALAAGERASFQWRAEFIREHLERDLPQLGIRVPSLTLRRFWSTLARRHGERWNSAELARSMGTQEDTVRRYLDILTGSFMLRRLEPWLEGAGKRLVKAPKVYVRDSGLLHALLGVRTPAELRRHPQRGSSWEGFALEQVVRAASAERDSFFYATHGGAELDLLIARGEKRFGFEFQHADAPRTTRSMHEVIKDLGLARLWVVHPGGRAVPLAERIHSVPLPALARIIRAESGRILQDWPD